jgi:hypothetical protein
MKYIKLFEQYDPDYKSKFNNYTRDKEISEENRIRIESVLVENEVDIESRFDSYDEAKEFLYNIANSLENLPNEVTLYRAIVIESGRKDDIVLENFGNHFVLIKEFLYSKDYLLGIGIETWDFDKVWLMEVLVNKDDISLENTFYQNFIFPEEEEIYIKSNIKPIDMNIEKIRII